MRKKSDGDMRDVDPFVIHTNTDFCITVTIFFIFGVLTKIISYRDIGISNKLILRLTASPISLRKKYLILYLFIKSCWFEIKYISLLHITLLNDPQNLLIFGSLIPQNK